MRPFSAFMALVAVVMLVSCQKEEEIVDPIVPEVFEEGAILSGRVTDSAGNPLANVAVTDGFIWSVTDAEGNYRFESPFPERVHYVSARIPSDYGPLLIEGRPVFWSGVSSWQGRERKADIVLERREDSGDRFTMLMMADPQARAYSAESNAENIAFATRDVWEDMFADMREVLGHIDGPSYGMCLGDISYNIQNWQPVYSQYCLGLESLGIPFFQVIGNHDQLLSGVQDDDSSAAPYEAIFGPRNYSFYLGKFHFIVLDNCIYDPKESGYPFRYGLEDAFLSWLKEDLASVPKDTPVMICTHANTIDFMEAIQGFDKVYVWMGHLHQGRFTGVVDTPKNVSGVEAFTLARVCGQLPGNLAYSRDGTPRGYVILEAEGKNISWHFRPIRESTAPWRGAGQTPDFKWGALPEDAQMHVYPRGAYDDDFVYANVFLWDKHWGTPVLSAGSWSVPMSRDYCYDMAFKENVQLLRANGIDEETLAGYASTYSVHSFRARVPEGASGMATVSVTDRFGKTWSQEVSVDPIRYDDVCRHLVFDFREAPAGCPSSSSTAVELSCQSGSSIYTMTLSKGYHSAGEGEEGYLVLDGAGSTLTLPAIPGSKLVGITVHPAGNTMSYRTASLVDGPGEIPLGGEKIDFYGECADNWYLPVSQVYAAYKIKSLSADFRIGELRLTYRPVDSVGYPGNSNTFILDSDSDVEF